MALVAPDLPVRFPCWCRAVYSWGGETKRDLGFIEGDLIECLNAGDGSWWMGRLKRDKRMVGLFPSNFVEVLDDGHHTLSRSTSPMPSVQSGQGSASPIGSPIDSRQPSPQPLKTPTKSFRKPFAAYSRAGSPNPTALTRDLSTSSRDPSQPCPDPARQPSPFAVANGNGAYHSRGPSPAPSVNYHQSSRGPSPNPYQDTGSSPPPAPPPHRITYDPHRAPSPAPSFHGQPALQSNIPRPHTAVPPSPHAHGHTPSPLRDAMDDIMTSLQDMSFRPESASPDRPRSPLNPWSPEAFDEHFSRARTQRHARPRTSLGIGGRRFHENDDDVLDAEGYDGPGGDHSRTRSIRVNQHDPSHPTNYVERMENRLRDMQHSPTRPPDELFFPTADQAIVVDARPAVPPKNASYDGRPTSSLDTKRPDPETVDTGRQLRNRKSAYELGRAMLGRTFTTKSSATSAASSGIHSTSTNQSTSTQRTGQSVMSGQSAGGFSATSAGSLARRRGGYNAAGRRPMSVVDTRREGHLGSDQGSGAGRPESDFTGVTFHSSHDSRAGAGSGVEWTGSLAESGGSFGGLMAPRPKKSGFFKKIIESAKTGAASARSSIAAGQPVSPQVPPKSLLPSGISSISGGHAAAREMGLGSAGSNTSGSSGIDWVQVRRDVNRSNSLSRNERVERQERCQMMEYPVIAPVDTLLESTDGDEGLDGHPIQKPTNFQAVNLGLVDKNARFINNLPPMTNAISLSQGYVCRPYRSDVQRLRAIFIWVSEKISWEEDFEGEIDSRRVIQLKRACAEEVAVLVMDMCSAVGMHAEVVRGHLKTPGEVLELGTPAQPNHWWNAVTVDGEWRIMDCSLASPTNPKRGLYSSANSQQAESWWFLSRPMDICYTHIAMAPEQQHLCPQVHQDILMSLPCACPPYFKNALCMLDYDTSLLRIEELEQLHIHFSVPSDIECVAEVEARAFARDADGDYFESGEVVRKRALAQAEWVGGQKRYIVKALLPGDEGQGVLKIYAGKRGLMHSIKDNPHPLAFAVPIIHTGKNPPYDFLTRHPTPHAQRHDLYVAQPQCARLAVNNTFVFAVRQHPSSLVSSSPENGSTSPVPQLGRPTSAMSMTSSSASGSVPNNSFSQKKPAKLAIQAPSGKILRLMRKSEHTISTSGPGGGEAGDGGVWETIIKCGERGIWRGLVLADRSARWCVFAEWTCV